MTGNKKTPRAGERYLGAYLFGLCVYQFAIYRWPGGPPFILDPRAGISILLINHFSFDNKILYPVHWITTAWLAFVTIMIFFRSRFLKVYLVSELLLAFPTAYYIAVLAIRHGGDFAPGFKDLVLTVFLFTIFSLIPMAWAGRCILQGKTVKGQI
jgi:hypothetical protein